MRRTWFCLGIAAVATSSLLLVACGNDDDDAGMLTTLVDSWRYRIPGTDGGYGIFTFAANHTYLDCWIENPEQPRGPGNTGSVSGTWSAKGKYVTRCQEGGCVTHVCTTDGDRLTLTRENDGLDHSSMTRSSGAQCP